MEDETELELQIGAYTKIEDEAEKLGVRLKTKCYSLIISIGKK